ncbi:MAG: TolC family protein [Treponema sp.]|nr:TolC family protein [Treponema sp.]
MRPPLAIPLFLVCAISAFGQDMVRVTIDEAVALALRNNLSLQASRIGTETKKRKADTAWNVLVPTVEIAGTLARSNVATSSTGFLPVRLWTLSPPDNMVYGVSPYTIDLPQWSVSGSLSVSLNINFALFEGIRNLRLEYEGGLVSYEAAKSQLERDVRKSYYQILLLQQNIELVNENLRAAERRVELARANFEAGLAPELTLLQAQVAMENLKPAINEMGNSMQVLLVSFVMTLGLPRGTQIELGPAEIPPFAPLDIEDLVAKASSGKPEIQELRQNIIIMESRRKMLTHQAYTPYLSLGWNADPTFQGDPWKDPWFNLDNWKQRSGMFRVTLGFRLNSLLPFSSESQGIKDVDDTLRTLNINLGLLIRSAEVSIYNAVSQLEKSQVTVEALRRTVELAEKTYRLTEEAYHAGLSDLLEVQNAELELHKARLEVVKETNNYLMGLLDLEYAIGVPQGTLFGSQK